MAKTSEGFGAPSKPAPRAPRLRSRLTGALGFVLAATISSPAFAQDPRDLSREGFSIAVMWTAQYAVGQVVSARISTGSRKVGADLDLGWVVKPRKLKSQPVLRPGQFSFVPTGFVVAAGVRWMPRGRHTSGWGTAIAWGARFVQGKLFDEKHEDLGAWWTKGFDQALDISRITNSGARFGGAVGVSATMVVNSPHGRVALWDDGPFVFGNFYGGRVR